MTIIAEGLYGGSAHIAENDAEVMRRHINLTPYTYTHKQHIHNTRILRTCTNTWAHMLYREDIENQTVIEGVQRLSRVTRRPYVTS